MDRVHMGFRAGYLLAIGGSGQVYRVGRGHERTSCPAPGMLTAKWGGGGSRTVTGASLASLLTHKNLSEPRGSICKKSIALWLLLNSGGGLYIWGIWNLPCFSAVYDDVRHSAM